jgi:protein-L-isoaspartate O-methyltransferase
MGYVERPFQHLLDLSNDHLSSHGANCFVYPSPRAPRWAAVATAFSVGSVLEVGCGLGYQAVCIADSVVGCRVETIENDQQHAELAAA